MHSVQSPVLPPRTLFSYANHPESYPISRPCVFLQVWIIFIRERGVRCSLHFVVVLFKQGLINLHGRRFQGYTGNEFLRIYTSVPRFFLKSADLSYQSRIANKLPRQP